MIQESLECCGFDLINYTKVKCPLKSIDCEVAINDFLNIQAKTVSFVSWSMLILQVMAILSVFLMLWAIRIKKISRESKELMKERLIDIFDIDSDVDIIIRDC